MTFSIGITVLILILIIILLLHPVTPTVEEPSAPSSMALTTKYKKNCADDDPLMPLDSSHLAARQRAVVESDTVHVLENGNSSNPESLRPLPQYSAPSISSEKTVNHSEETYYISCVVGGTTIGVLNR